MTAQHADNEEKAQRVESQFALLHSRALYFKDLQPGDKQIPVIHCSFNLRQTRIEMFECARKAFSVATVAVEHVEINQIRKDQAARFTLQRLDRLIDRLLVVLRRQVLRDSH